MQELIIYLLKSAGLMSLFFAAYFFLLRNDTKFKTNRIFLLAGIFTSILLPFLEITRTIVVETVASPAFFENLPVTLTSTSTVQVSEINWWQIAGIVYLIGLGFFLLKFFIELLSLLKLIGTHKVSKEQGFYIIQKAGNIQPFSFFKFIVFDPNQHTPAEREMILKHECCHARQWHSIDQLLASLSVYLLWFNPLAWLYRKSVVQNLEYLADKEVIAARVSKKEYQKTLLKISIGDFQPALTNQFYQSFIKKRIIMLNKNSTQKSSFWKTGVLLPILVLFIFSFNIKTEAQVKEPKAVSVSYSYDPDMHFAVVTKDATDKDLEELEKDFSENGTTLEFTKVERSAKGEIIDIALIYKNKKTGNTGNLSQDDPEGIPGFTLTVKKGWFSHKILSGREKQEGSLMGIGNAPLYIIEGKEYSTSQLTDSYVEVKGEWSVLKPKEAEERFGSKAKDGAIIISESNIIKDFKAALKDVDLKKRKINQTFIQVNRDASPILMSIKTQISQNPPNQTSSKFELQDVDFLEEPSEINAIQRDKVTFSNFSFQEKKPLIVVGGVIMKKDYKLTVIEPTEIKSINVLKGESALEKYGEQAENGAIEIQLSDDGEVLEDKEVGQKQSSEKKEVQFSADSIKFKASENPTKNGSEVKIFGIYKAQFSPSDALYVVNEKVMPKDFDPESIDHNNIQSITVLKGPKATEKYGDKAAKFGAIEITTKK